MPSRNARHDDHPASTPDAFKQRLEEMLKRHEEELITFGEEVRTTLVIPACRRYRLRFMHGHGSFDFSQMVGAKSYGTYGDSKDLEGDQYLSKAAKAEIGPILDLLNAEISHGQYLGYRVGAFDPTTKAGS